ncbi:unnamed protein product [Heterobilharzia americana]|nr:unnamed protein product [Heterobilharzia americana]
MPTPNILVNSVQDDNNDSENLKTSVMLKHSKLSVPKLRIVNDDADETENNTASDDDEDVMTAEEEAAAARRFLSGSDSTEQRRMSSLDMYLSQPEVKPESMIINRHVSLKAEEKDYETEQQRLLQEEREEMEKHQEQLRKEREEVKKARASKRHSKVIEEQEVNRNHQARRMTYRKQGLGGMSKERRKKLKEMIMQKAKDELVEERRKELNNREDYIRKRAPPFDIDGLSQTQLQEKIKSWYECIKDLESQKYDWEQRLRKQDEEINDLTAQLCAIKGHFQKPILRRVPKPMPSERLRAMSAAPSFTTKGGHANFVELKRKKSDTNRPMNSNFSGSTEVYTSS